MQIVVNGEIVEAQDGLTVAQLIAQRYGSDAGLGIAAVSYTHLRAHET